jgi:hypothetical protein
MSLLHSNGRKDLFLPSGMMKRALQARDANRKREATRHGQKTGNGGTPGILRQEDRKF